MNTMQFNTRFGAINDYVNHFLTNNGWSNLLPQDNDTDEMHSFYAHLMYVVLQFLETEDFHRELFIKIPVEELSNKLPEGDDSLQRSRWKSLANTLMASLALATRQATLDTLSPTNGQYRDRDFFMCIDLRGTFYCEYVARTQTFVDRGRDCTQRFNQSTSKYRIAPPTTLNTDIDIISAGNSLNGYFANMHFNSAALISQSNLQPDAENIPWMRRNLIFPVKFFNNYRNVTGRDDHYEIIIVLGDKQYKNCLQAYRNTNARKIIYIGSEIDADINTYPFTIREMYQYCCPDYPYEEPNITRVGFPWLDETCRNLENLLKRLAETDQTITPEIRDLLVRKLTCKFQNSDFSQDILEYYQEKCDDERIANLMDFDVNPDSVSQIVEWYKGLHFEGANPKMKWAQEMPQCLMISKWDSYKRKVKNLHGYDNTILLDNLSHSTYDTRLTDIQRHILGVKLKGIYYDGYEDISITLLNNYLSQEDRYYNSNLRIKWKTAYLVDKPRPTFEIMGSLEEYHELDNESQNWYKSYNNARTQYQVHFTDNTQEYITGDVLVVDENGCESCNVQDLSPKERSTIKFYKTPERFNDYAKMYLGLPQGADVEAFSIIWKTAYRNLIAHYNTRMSENDTFMCLNRTYQIKISLLRNYARDIEITPKFLREEKDMKNMCNMLFHEGFIDETQCYMVQRARKLNNKNSDLGGKLKEQLLRNILQENTDYSFIDEFLRRCNLSLEEIINESIHEKTIQNIIITHSN